MKYTWLPSAEHKVESQENPWQIHCLHIDRQVKGQRWNIHIQQFPNLKLSSKPKLHNGVLIDLTPDIECTHDESYHQYPHAQEQAYNLSIVKIIMDNESDNQTKSNY